MLFALALAGGCTEYDPARHAANSGKRWQREPTPGAGGSAGHCRCRRRTGEASSGCFRHQPARPRREQGAAGQAAPSGQISMTLVAAKHRSRPATPVRMLRLSAKQR